MPRKSTKKRTGAKAPKRSTVHDAPYNPRRIDDKALAGLKASMVTFGDLSGFVINRRTSHVVCGHQRRAALAGADFDAVEYGKPYTVELGDPGKRFKSREREGVLATPDGAHTRADGVRFRVRQVDWPLAFEKAANVAANNPAIQGSFTEDLDGLLAEIKAELPALSEITLLDDLLTKPTEDGASTDQKTEADGLQYRVVIDCENQVQQRKLLRRLKAEKLVCHAVAT